VYRFIYGGTTVEGVEKSAIRSFMHKTEESPNTSQGCLLIVDDQIEVVDMLREAFRLEGYKTLGFHSGTEALEALKVQDFDLLITDMIMPGMDGITLLKEALTIAPYLVGIIMTGEGDVRTAVEAMKLGAFDYILKPFRPNQLSAIVSRAMAMSRANKDNIQLRGAMTVYELTAAMSLTADVDSIAGTVCDLVLKQSHGDEVSIMLPAEGCNELYVAAVRGEGRSHILGERVNRGTGVAGWVAEHREMLQLEGEIRDERFGPGYPRPDIRFALSMPLMTGGRFVGILNVNSVHRHSFTAGEIKTLTMIAGIAASSLENSLFFNQMWALEERYRAIFEHTGAAAMIIGEDMMISLINSEAERLSGYAKDEIEGRKSWMDFVHKDDMEMVKEYHGWGKADPEGATRNGEIRFVDRWGDIKTVFLMTGIIPGTRNRIASMIDITTRKQAEETLHQTMNLLQEALRGVIDVVVMAVETRDPYTSGHQKRVSKLAYAMAKDMELADPQIEGILMAGLIHDLGKIAVPADILSKPTKLSDLERSLVRLHPENGYAILKNIHFPWPLAEIVLQHHERLDGSGYPRGLKNDQILCEARIIGIADVVEAIASHRPYRAALGINAALEEVEKNKGILYDAGMVEICLRLFREKGFTFA
jgi:PAS domain S-box-containing protein